MTQNKMNQASDNIEIVEIRLTIEELEERIAPGIAGGGLHR